MPRTANILSRTSLLRRPDFRPEKAAIITSATAFFGAIGVIGWFGISGLQLENREDDSTARVIFAGGAPQQPVAVVRIDSASNGVIPDSEYVVGEFGDPVDDLFMTDGDGGWGVQALAVASDFGVMGERDEWQNR